MVDLPTFGNPTIPQVKPISAFLFSVLLLPSGGWEKIPPDTYFHASWYPGLAMSVKLKKHFLKATSTVYTEIEEETGYIRGIKKFADSNNFLELFFSTSIMQEIAVFIVQQSNSYCGRDGLWQQKQSP